MNIGIVGLGLIGGSMAKAVLAFRKDKVFATDCNEEILKKAMTEKVICGTLDEETLPKCDLLLIALYPEASINYISEHKALISPNAVVVDCCGVKEYVCRNLAPIAKEQGFIFVGGHPMAGKEVAGYDNAEASLFTNASMILTPEGTTPEPVIKALSTFFSSLGFANIEITTAKNHDRNIAFTSQLAHVVSNAYVKSPLAQVHQGFSAGSYKDMTRVAKLEETMWTELFFENKDHLLTEINTMIGHLQEYASAMENDDTKQLQALLKAGRERKEAIDNV